MVVMLDEESLESGRGLRNHALSLRGLRNMHSRPQSWKHFFSPMLCRRNMHLHCPCLSPMPFCKYSFITFLPMRPPASAPALKQARKRSWVKTICLNKWRSLCTLLSHKWFHFCFCFAFLSPLHQTPTPPHFPSPCPTFLSKKLFTCLDLYASSSSNWSCCICQQWALWLTTVEPNPLTSFTFQDNDEWYSANKHSLYHWINDSLAFTCCWYLGIKSKIFPHFVNILGFHLHSKFQFEMFLLRSLA